MKKVVIFDFDGTLADSLPVLLSSYNSIAPRFGLKHVKVEEIQKYRKLSYREMFQAVGLRRFMLPMVIRAGTREFRRREHDVKLFKGIPELLQFLIDKKYEVGILTSNHSDVVASVLQDYNITKLDFIVSQRSLFAKHKAFRKLEKVHGYAPSDIVYVGDESRDVIACRKAGVEVIGVTWGLGGPEAFTKTPPDTVVTTIDELKKAIDRYMNE